MAYTPDQFRKERQKVENAYKKLESERASRLRALQMYVGADYGAGAAETKISATVVNMLEMMVNIYLQNLVSGNPQGLVTTNKFALRMSAKYFEMALNHVIRRIDLQLSLRQATIESLFSMGIMKIGVVVPEEDQYGGYLHDQFLPYVDPVPFDDFVYDTTVQRWEQVEFMGSKCRMSKDDVRKDPRNNPSAVAQIGDSANAFGQSEERAEDLTGGDTELFAESPDDNSVDVWEIYYPRTQMLVTYCEGANIPLRMVPWTGPENGPYHILRYNMVLNNIMPLPPIINMLSLSDLLNELWCKMGEQASRQKTVGIVHPSAAADGEKTIRCNDGEFITSSNPQSVTQVRFGGVEQSTLAFSATVRDMFSYLGGNLDTLGGLSTGADTLGQEEMLAKSSSNRIRSMQNEVVRFTKAILRDVGWYLWNDPLVKLNFTSKIEGSDMEFEATWPQAVDDFGVEQDLRIGQYNDLNFEVSPYSLQDKAPSERLQTLRTIFQQDVLPMIPYLQAEGVAVNFTEYLKKVGKYSDLPELDEVISAGHEPMEAAPTDMSTPKPANTTRQYERVVKGGGTNRRGMDRMMAAGMSNSEGSSVS